MKSSTFIDSTVIYFLNRGVLMPHLHCIFLVLYPSLYCKYNRGRTPNAMPTNMQAFRLMKIGHSTFSSLINVTSYINSGGKIEVAQTSRLRCSSTMLWKQKIYKLYVLILLFLIKMFVEYQPQFG